ncbi:unnamed protein product, partial [Prorocentrum cordatum]
MGEAYDPFGDGPSGACPAPPRAPEPPLKRPRREAGPSPDREAADARIRRRNPHNKRNEELIGFVRPVSSKQGVRVCVHFLQNDCLWGDKCRFSHNPEELRAGAPETTAMSFSDLEVGLVTRAISVPRAQLRYLTTEGTRQLLVSVSGVSEVTWDADEAKMTLSGHAAQVENAEKLLRRVVTHCNWGISEEQEEEVDVDNGEGAQPAERAGVRRGAADACADGPRAEAGGLQPLRGEPAGDHRIRRRLRPAREGPADVQVPRRARARAGQG